MFYWNPSHGWKVCLGLLGSVCRFVHLSVHPSVYLSSILLSALLSFQTVSFVEIYTLVFVIFGMGLGLPVELFVEFLQKNLVLAEMTKKWSKMTQKWDFSTIFKNFVINFCKKHQSSYTNTIFGKILFLELQLVKAKALNQSD